MASADIRTRTALCLCSLPRCTLVSCRLCLSLFDLFLGLCSWLGVEVEVGIWMNWCGYYFYIIFIIYSFTLPHFTHFTLPHYTLSTLPYYIHFTLPHYTLSTLPYYPLHSSLYTSLYYTSIPSSLYLTAPSFSSTHPPLLLTSSSPTYFLLSYSTLPTLLINHKS